MFLPEDFSGLEQNFWNLIHVTILSKNVKVTVLEKLFYDTNKKLVNN